MSHACALTKRFIQVLWDHYGKNDSGLFELDVEGEFQEVLAEAQLSAPNTTTSSLRAFYALEVMYNRFFFNKHYMSPEGSPIELFTNRKFERSTQGLLELDACLAQLADDMGIHAVSIQLNRNLDWGESSMHANSISTWLAVVPLVHRSSVSLRAFLRNSTPKHPWSCSGKYLAKACIVLNHDVMDCIKLARTLLTINPKNVLYPWTIPTRSQG